ncbi:MAG: hypothetical protein MB55_00765 [marine actinobacterium MedAcidi-G3]|nr:MAG: hypothetical protein MB55_00765 [marine actinobacterium MedAcidi-G3]MBA4812728.1 DUF1330 domain-containing protein [Acidimicrobiales bacterium]|tara:strand:- start:315 stop:599 length:285 start_codon:yes stop_codon:yes gene_type:complete
MAAYVFFQGEVTDEGLYAKYKEKASATVGAYGGTYLVRGGPWSSLEGDEPAPRTVVISFDSVEAANAWYNSPEYEEARPIRQSASVGSLYIVEG